MTKTVAIVEDNLAVCESVQRSIASSSDFTLAWIAHDLKQARAAMVRPTDILLLDLGLPDGRGTDLIKPMGRKRPVVVVFTLFGDETSVIDAIEAGVDGYVLKGADTPELLEALRAAAAGDSPISPAVAGFLLRRLRQRERQNKSNPMNELTPRERDVLETLARGHSYREAANILGMQTNTLAHHVKNLYPKLAATSRSEAVFNAVQQGLIKL